MVCNSTHAMIGGFVGGLSIGMAMIAFALIFVTLKYRALLRRRS